MPLFGCTSSFTKRKMTPRFLALEILGDQPTTKEVPHFVINAAKR